MHLGILASGGLGYTTIIQLLKEIDKPIFIATDSKSVQIIEYCKSNDIDVFVGNPRKGKLFSFLSEREIELDLILSINYLFLLDKELIDYLPLSINLHGSLLPKYRGRTPHVWSIINGEKYTGVTAHLIDQNCDTGDIIKQVKVPITENDTGAKILDKYENIYPSLLISVLNDISNEKLQRIKQDDSKATYFGKRIPEDGLINWDWQKDRIRNWVRAQAYPYPGSFSFINGEKIIVDKIKFSDKGFEYSAKNGTVLDCNPNPIIKCPNGAIELNGIRNKEVIKNIKPNMVLN